MSVEKEEPSPKPYRVLWSRASSWADRRGAIKPILKAEIAVAVPIVVLGAVLVQTSLFDSSLVVAMFAIAAAGAIALMAFSARRK